MCRGLPTAGSREMLRGWKAVLCPRLRSSKAIYVHTPWELSSQPWATLEGQVLGTPRSFFIMTLAAALGPHSSVVDLLYLALLSPSSELGVPVAAMSFYHTTEYWLYGVLFSELLIFFLFTFLRPQGWWLLSEVVSSSCLRVLFYPV